MSLGKRVASEVDVTPEYPIGYMVGFAPPPLMLHSGVSEMLLLSIATFSHVSLLDAHFC